MIAVNMSHTDRIVALIDMDCFYCQVEEKLDPKLAGKPIAVVQYNQWKGGGIIAVNYPAREKGVTRQMRGDEAREKCPDIELPRVPQVRGKADLTKYREAGKQVAEVLMSSTKILERASIDEAYLDLTEAVNTELKNGLPIISLQDMCNTFVVGQETADFMANIYQNRNSGFYEDDIKLLVGGFIVERIRAAVYEKTGFRCSAGIAHNKILAKLVCSLHKPNKQTILPQGAVTQMFANLPIRKIKNLGGKFGHILSEKMNIQYIGELLRFSEKELIQKFDEKTGRWLYNVARGIDKDPVQVKLVSKSIGCCKRFPGRTSLCKANAVEHWMKELSSEISDRLYEDLKENNRKAKLMTVSFSQETNQTEISSTRAVPLKSYEMDKICQQAIEVLEKYCRKPDGSYHITFLGLSIGNFENIKNVKTITSFFKRVDKTEPNTKKIDIFDDCSHNNDPTYTNSIQKDSARSTIIPEKESEMLMEVPLHDSDISICDEKSIFSDTTVELEEEPDDLFFYDDHTRSDRIYTEKLQARKTAGNKNLNFIALETNVLPNLKNSPNSPISYSPVLQSIKHENIDDESDSSREIKRNFDTSKIFRESYNSSDEENENITLEGSQSCTAELSENCKECGKHISVVDMVSHMDYHLALKLSKEIIPANEKLLQTKQKNNPPPKKRKICQTLGNIKSFCIQKNMNPDEITELCTECNKRIKIEDVSTHHDYHAAKKLHLELNSPSSKSERFNSNNPIASSSKVSSNNKNKKKIGKGKNISSFFKQLDS